MKKITALLLAMLMIVTTVGMVSAEGDKTLLECLGGKGVLNYEVKTEALAKASTGSTYFSPVEVYAFGERAFDFKAVLDMSGVKNLIALAKTKIEGLKDYTGNFGDLDVKGTFNVKVTYPEGITAPELTEENYSLVSSDIFVAATPVVDSENRTITVTVSVKDGVKAKDIENFADTFVLTANGFAASEIGEYVLTGVMTGSTDIYEGKDLVYTVNYTSVDKNDEKLTPSVTVNIKKRETGSGSSSSSSSSNSGSTSSATTVDVTGDETVKVEASTSGSTATIKDIKAEDLEKAGAEGSDLVIDLSGLKKGLDSAKISSDTIKNIADSGVKNVEINLGKTTVVIDSETVEAISENATGKDVEIGVDTDVKLNDKQKEAVKELDKAVTLEATITSGGKAVEGNVKVTVPYASDEKGVILAAKVSEDGTLENVPVLYKDGTVEAEVAAGESVVVWTVPAEKAFVLTIEKKDASVFGGDKSNDVAPKIVKDRTMLPARFVAENLGAKVEWNEEKREVTVTGGDVTIVITIDSNVALVNGEEVELDSPAFIENDRTYTPIRFIAEHLGATVYWNGATEQVVITK